MKQALLLISTILLATLVFSQQGAGVAKGVIRDAASSLPLAGASVSVFLSKDSVPNYTSLSSDSGYFEIRNLDSGTYRLRITYQGYDAHTKDFSLTRKSPVADLGTLRIGKAYKTLAEVVVKDRTPVRIKGDTVAYNADAFKTRPNATAEDLLKKLPGVQVDRTGAVSAQGESVQKVYIDGKEYFGNELEMATKNLTADMIDQVQVFDDKSEQSKFSGVDDGNRSKAINLRLKKEARKGASGNVYAGGGLGQYNAGIRGNYFKGASQISLNASANNINARGYTASDLSRIGNSVGLSKTSSFGLNYRDTWSKSFDAAGSYTYNQNNTSNNRTTLRQSFLTGSTMNTNRLTDYNTINRTHRFNQKIIYTIDSLNSIVFTPNLTIQRSRSLTTDTLSDFIETSALSYKRSNSRTINNVDGHGHSLFNNLIWRRRFNKQGRTFSANLFNTLSRNERTGLNQIHASFFNDTGNPYRQRNTDYRTGDQSGTGSYTLSLSYTEPLSKSSLAEVNYSNSRSRNTSDKEAFSYNPQTGAYDEPNDTLTNNFQQVLKFNRVGANFRDVKKTYNYQLGLSLQQSVLSANSPGAKTNLTQRYTNIIPTFSLNYRPGKNRSLRLAYRGRNNQPSVLQLQDVPDISNYPFIRKGNPELRQEFTHNLMLSYNFFHTQKLRNVFASLFYMGTQNKIVNALQITEGEQILTPANVRGTYSLNGSFGYGIPIKRMEGGNISTTTRISYNQMPGFVNGERNEARNLQLGEDVNLSFTYKEALDLNIQAGLAFHSVKHSIQSVYNNSYLSQNYSLDMAYSFPHHLLLSSTIDFTGYSGREAAPGDNFVMWNASVSKPVLKNNRGELTLSIHNLLNQNNSIVRNVYENVIEDIQNQTQKRFALLTFTYNFNKLRGK